MIQQTKKAFQLLIYFICGAVYGVLLAYILSDGYGIAAFVGLIMLPICFAIYATYARIIFFLYFGAGFVQVLKKKQLDEEIRQRFIKRMDHIKAKGLPGSPILIMLIIVICLIAGIIFGSSPHSLSFWIIIPVCCASGLVYGILLHRLSKEFYVFIDE